MVYLSSAFDVVDHELFPLRMQNPKDIGGAAKTIVHALKYLKARFQLDRNSLYVNLPDKLLTKLQNVFRGAARLGKDKCAILRLSAPLKEQYAKEHGLDFSRLLDATEYKEKHRADMIRWGEEKRNADPAYFCDIITRGPGSELPVWIISDARRPTDVAFFQERYPHALITVRVSAEDEVRKRRGWVFTSGVDDAESECGLDTHVHDIEVANNNQSLDAQLDSLCAKVLQRL